MAADFKIPTLEEVMNSFNGVFKIIDLLDRTYKMDNNNYVMRFYQNRGVTLRTIFLNDMLEWLCFLGWRDGNIDENEVAFINLLLNLNLNQLDIFEIVKKVERKDLSVLPLTFAIFIEHLDSNPQLDNRIIDALIALFFISGSYLIVCDGDVDENEVRGFTAYMETLKYNVRTFDLNSLHNYMLDQI